MTKKKKASGDSPAPANASASAPPQSSATQADSGQGSQQNAVSTVAKTGGYAPAAVGGGAVAPQAPTRVLDVREAIRLNDFDMLVECGLLMQKAGESGEALMLLRQACVARPKHQEAQVHYTLARLATNPRERIEHAQLYTELKPGDPYGWLMLGNVQDDAGNYEAALAAYTKSREVDPTEYRAVVSSCRMLSKLGREDDGLAVAEAGVKSGALENRWQRPSHYIRGLSVHAWHDVSNWRVRRVLEDNFAMIREEIMAIFESGTLQKQGADDTESLTKSGNWKELNLLFQGIMQSHHAKFCPKTVDLIEREIPEAASMVRGAVKISILTPGTVIKPHHGPSNTRMRSHLGIRIPSGCFIRAGDPAEPKNTRQWEEGKLLCFDDSFRHEVWHEGTEPRIILTVDVWHPQMNHQARIASCDSDHQKQVYMARYQIGQEGAGWD